MTNATITISEPVTRVLDRCAVDSDRARVLLPNELDRKLYVEVNKVLEALGGKWNRSAKAHLFAVDPSDDLADAIATGQVIDMKKALQFYETPAAVVERMIRLADLTASMRVLEPSAGHGAIISRVALAVSLHQIDAVEIDHAKCVRLSRELGIVYHADFLTLVPAREYDRVLMNSPFTRQQDIAHVRRAFDWLVPGGRLVAVLTPAWTFRTNELSRQFREWVQAKPYTWEELPAGTFKASGTGVSTGLLTLHCTN